MTTVDSPPAAPPATEILAETPHPAVQVYGRHDALFLLIWSQITTIAVPTPWGWHISLGRVPVGGNAYLRASMKRGWHPAARPNRCAWWSAPDKAAAVQWLYLLGARLVDGHHAA